MKLLLSLFLIGTLSLSTSCKKGKADICDLNTICYTDKPDELYLKLELSSSPSNNPIEISLYIGYLDDGKLYETFSTTESEIYYLLPVGERYTASAKYKDGSDFIKVIDSEKMNSYSYKNCEETCYDWDEEIVLDLKLD